MWFDELIILWGFGDFGLGDLGFWGVGLYMDGIGYRLGIGMDMELIDELGMRIKNRLGYKCGYM